MLFDAPSPECFVQKPNASWTFCISDQPTRASAPPQPLKL